VAEPRVSVLILARNEEENLPGCLDSVAWADQVVVVVDRSSQDATLELARSRADLAIERTFDDFARQRNAALDLASGDWVFAVDADERSSLGQGQEIRRLTSDTSSPNLGYRVPIESVILGRSFRYSGTQNDRPLRLFRRGRGRWVGAVHETVDLDGAVSQLVEPLRHSTIPDMQMFLRKINEYTSLEAMGLTREGRPYQPADLALRPAWTFLKLYLAKQGFRDGPEGLAFCALSGVSVAVRHWKHRELVRARRAS
jgi:hypothetical protein